MTTDRARQMLLTLLVGAILAVLILQATAPVAADDNETVIHEHPDDYEEDGDLERIQGWLADSLSSSLEDSAVSIGAGEYETAQEILGDDYDERLERYVEVTDRPEEPENDSAAAYDDAATDQESVASNIERYESILEDFEEAVAAGEEEEARELARELESIATEIGATSASLEDTYDSLERVTERDYSSAREATNDTVTEIDDRQTTIREEHFERTTLVVEPADRTISPSDPLEFTATLEDETGEPVEDVDVSYAVEGVSVVTATGSANGEFQPTTQPAGETSLYVRGNPEADSVYLAAETALNVTIEQEQLSLDDVTVSDPATLGQATIEGAGHVDGEPVDGVPLAVSIGDETLGEVSIDNGTIDDSVMVPATVSTGEQTVEVRFPPADRALSEVTETETITVEATDATIDLEEPTVTEESVSVAGTVQADGGGVTAVPVTVSAGEESTSVTTDEAGTFNATLPIEDGTDEVTVEAAVDSDETNLQAATATETVGVGEPAGEGLSIPGSMSLWLLTIGGVAVLVVAASWYRRTRTPHPDRLIEEPAVGGDSPPAEPTIDTGDVIEQAAEARAAGDLDGAVRMAYGAARRAIRPDASSLTHWEFVERSSETITEEELETLETLTATYELAQYAASPVSADDADAALSTARALCSSLSPEAPTDFYGRHPEE